MLKFIDTSPIIYEQKLIEAYEKLTGRTLYPADPERLIINLIAYAMTVTAINIDESARQNLLAYAEGDKLDALAELYGITRLPAQPARTTLRFSIDAPLNFDVVIPAGTRATADGNIFFATQYEAKIPAGQTSVDVEAICSETGAAGNGFQIGQINRLVDPLPYVSSVSNVTMSMYGTDIEDDDRFRERIRISIERFTNAGSRGAYIFHTKTVHQDIDDVEVFSPAPGQVKVLFLMKGGLIPSQDMIQAVQSYLSGEKVRPLTDQVFVSAPDVVYYDISLTYYIHKKDSTLQQVIDTAVKNAVNEFALWTRTKIGRDILPEELIKRVKEAGAYRVIVQSPTYQELAISQVAQARNISILYGGTVED